MGHCAECAEYSCTTLDNFIEPIPQARKKLEKVRRETGDGRREMKDERLKMKMRKCEKGRREKIKRRNAKDGGFPITQ